MKTYEEIKNSWPNKTDAQIIEQLGNEVKDKVEEIGNLLNRISDLEHSLNRISDLQSELKVSDKTKGHMGKCSCEESNPVEVKICINCNGIYYNQN